MRRIKVIFLATTFVFCGVVAFAGQTYSEFRAALFKTESNSHNPKDGDGGEAIGPFQIHEHYWRDAIGFDPSLKNPSGYKACRNYAYACRVVDAYLQLYGREALERGDWKTLARIHNGGPDGHKKPATMAYWNKVQKYLKAKNIRQYAVE